MYEMIDKSKALEVTDKLLPILSAMGYVKHIAVVKVLAYQFLVDFADTVGYYFDEEDYSLMSEALAKLFTGGCCLMPYPVFHNGAVPVNKVDGTGVHYLD